MPCVGQHFISDQKVNKEFPQIYRLIMQLIFQYWSRLGCLVGNILINQNVLRVEKMQNLMPQDKDSVPVGWGAVCWEALDVKQREMISFLLGQVFYFIVIIFLKSFGAWLCFPI